MQIGTDVEFASFGGCDANVQIRSGLGSLRSLLLSCPSLAQQSINEAGLRGTVTDASGAVIPLARITLTDVATNVAHHTVSDHRGAYTFRALSPQPTRCWSRLAGFGRVEQDNIALTVNQQATLNATLRPARWHRISL